MKTSSPIGAPTRTGSVRIKSPTPFRTVFSLEEGSNDDDENDDDNNDLVEEAPTNGLPPPPAFPLPLPEERTTTPVSPLLPTPTSEGSATTTPDFQTPDAPPHPSVAAPWSATAPTPLVSNTTTNNNNHHTTATAPAASTTHTSTTTNTTTHTSTTNTSNNKSNNNHTTSNHRSTTTTPSLSPPRQFRSRRSKLPHDSPMGSSFKTPRRKRRRTPHRSSRKRSPEDEIIKGGEASSSSSPSLSSALYYLCCRDPGLARSTLSCMNVVARMLMWCSVLASVAAVVWYSYDFKRHGTDEHLIAWFSAGAFVLLGFPISIYGIVMHLANYNQPSVQMYVVRILWMVPIYSIESWLCLRYKDYAIYIETLRDCYESYVLYSFLQYLIQILGGEDALVLMLKDKSPTRGSHMWGLQWCVKPWLMGQPLRKTYEYTPLLPPNSTPGAAAATPGPSAATKPANASTTTPGQALKRVHWTSPFFVKCKFGVLQYVLLKFVCSIVVMILERNHVYKEGDFTPKGGYLYICILTNLSQCWALYCLIFFYYATKNELGSIRPVGKFLSVKALVFFTWWQAVAISMLSQAGLVPHYYKGSFVLGSSSHAAAAATEGSADALEAVLSDSTGPMSVEDALLLDDLGGTVFSNSSHAYYSKNAAIDQEWTAEEVAKGMQDWLICIEMFVAAIVHIYVFPHEEYEPRAVEARNRSLNQTPHKDWNKRLGRKWKEWDHHSGSITTHTSNNSELELGSFPSSSRYHHMAATTTMTSHQAAAVPSSSSFDEEDDLRIHPLDRIRDQRHNTTTSRMRSALGWGDDEGDDEEGSRERTPLLDLGPVPLESDREHQHSSHGGGGYNDDDNDDEFSASLEGSSGSFGDDDDDDEEEDVENPTPPTPPTTRRTKKPGFVKALLDSAIPQDLRDNTVGIIKGDYVVEKKTLLHHAATSDSYDLFSRVGRRRPRPPGFAPPP